MNHDTPDPRYDPKSHVVPSTVSVMQHPIHPMVVVYPIALLSLTFPSDLLYLLLGDPFWARASFLMLLGGFGVGIVAAVIGMIDFFTMKRVRSHVSAWSHFISAIVLLALTAANLNHRWGDYVESVLPWGIVLSAAMGLLVVVTGWLGGTLTFGHAIGSFEHERDVPPDDDRSPPRE
jgi:uncharacterized membrane protein